VTLDYKRNSSLPEGIIVREMAMQAGYYRFPAIFKDEVAFVCEDDIWLAPVGGGSARRLTSGLAEASRPVFSSDGQMLAFTGREEGQPELYVMAAVGGPVRRLTHMGASVCRTLDWTADNKIIFANNAGQPFSRPTFLYQIDPDGSAPEQINVGPALAISYGSDGELVIGRDTDDPALWKRYRGGRAGQLWIDRLGNLDFEKLVELDGNLASPMWLGGRIYFLSDHEGVGNLYSCLPDGSDIQRATDHDTYYARNASTDGRRIVYHAGGDLYLFDPTTASSSEIEIEFHSAQTQRNRKYVWAASYLDSWAVHPKGHSLAITSRGKAFSFANWEGAVLQHGEGNGPRYRLMEWLNDGERLIAISDQSGEESFVILAADANQPPVFLDGLDIGRPGALAINPKKDQVLFSNHRYEICVLDLKSKEVQIIDRGKSRPIAGFAWSPDGEWVVYSVSISLQVTVLKLWKASTGDITPLTKPVLRDVSPAFDPDGRYIYFLSFRHFDPVYDNLHFDLSFPRGVRPYLITLQKELPSPFVPLPRAPGEKSKKDDDNKAKPASTAVEVANSATGDEDSEEALEIEPPADTAVSTGETLDQTGEDDEEGKKIQIDLEGIQRRIVAFPAPEGKYRQILGIHDDMVLYSRAPAEGALGSGFLPDVPPAVGTVYSYDFQQQKEELLIRRVSSFALSRDGRTLAYRARNRLRVLKAGQKPSKDEGSKPGRPSGWIDLGRAKVSINPATEWRQMYREAWRLQRDQYWSSNMASIDWPLVYERYLPLVDRVASRAEFSDLLWEMQGELGTSHGYEMGGDYRSEPSYHQGYLGASFDFNEETESWQISEIVQGDAWEEASDSPLNKPGINVSAGDQLLAINGTRLSRLHSPAAALVNLAGQEVTLTLAGDDEEAARMVTVKSLYDETPARYRAWVERNRQIVHESSDGRVGYVHIPDMGPMGYAEFHRGYLAEVDRSALIVDVRNNRGGHVSQLILEKLARKRLGYDVSRWGQIYEPYPAESVPGPIVALTNEYSGSDGDIFSHGFKMLGIGPLIGKRTWGGVVGISPRHKLVDGTVTTQPEFSFWFTDVGFGVENYGTDPDIEVENRPQDWIKGADVQLERAVKEVMALLESDSPKQPDMGDLPNLSLPKLPPRP
jgi:tricorn protease